MSTQKSVRRKRLALLPALVLGAGAAVSAPLSTTAPATAAAPSVAPPATKGATVDWFDDKYTALGANSVFETATMERFEYLLKKPGKYAFIIGGPDSATLQASIGHINDVAKAEGISKIYNFNPKLDGGTLNVFDPSGLELSQTGKDYIGAYGTKLIQDYLGKDAETPFTAAHASDPYLFVYDGSGGDTARITGALTTPVTAADVDTPGEVTAYKGQVEDVLTSGGALAVDTQFDFLAGEHNRRLATRSNPANPSAYDQTKFGAPMFSAADATDGFRIQSVTYPELLHILQSPGDFALLFGGTWCHNTAAIVHEANKAAQDFGIKKVYAFDFVLNTNDPTASNGGSNLLHLRDNAVPPAGSNPNAEVRRASYLYGDLVNTYLPNAFTQYRKNGDPGSGGTNFVSYYPGGDTTKPLAEARKIQVGHLLSYNKDHKAADGSPAPVTNQAIRKNADGGYTEYMTEWWFVQGKDLPRSNVTLAGNSPTASENNLNALENNRAFAKEGIAKIRNVLAAIAGGYASEVVVSDVPGSVAVNQTIPATATVTSADYNGFFSTNGAGGNNAPATGVAKPTGTITVREGSTELLTATPLVDGAKALTIPALPAGQHTLTFEYSGSADGIIKSTTKTAQVNVGTAVASATSAVAPATTYGKAGTVTVSVTTTSSAQIRGAVTLTGAGAPITQEVSGGKAVFQLPASLTPKTYGLTATYAGSGIVTGSTASTSLTVGKGGVAGVAYKLNKKPTAKKKGKATVTVGAPAGLSQPTGKVKVTLKKGKTVKVVSGTLSAGKKTVKLPKLPKGTWKLTVSYAGNANYLGWTSKAYPFRITK